MGLNLGITDVFRGSVVNNVYNDRNSNDTIDGARIGILNKITRLLLDLLQFDGAFGIIRPD